MTCQLHPPIFLATAMSPSINLIASTSYHAYQPRLPHNHGTLPPNRLETKVAMMPADQTNEACGSNIVRDFGHHLTQADYEW